MLKGVFSRAGGALDRTQTEGLEHVARGPLAIAFDPAPTAVCADVDEVTCVLNGYLYDPSGLARHLGVAGGNPAELVAAAYRRSGEEILAKLRGRYTPRVVGRPEPARPACLRPASDGAALLLARDGQACVRKRAEGSVLAAPGYARTGLDRVHRVAG